MKRIQIMMPGDGAFVAFPEGIDIPRQGEEIVLTELGSGQNHRPKGWPADQSAIIVTAIRREYYVNPNGPGGPYHTLTDEHIMIYTANKSKVAPAKG